MRLRFSSLSAALFLILVSDGCSDRASVDDDDSIDSTSSALTQKLRLPFPAGHTWYICQSYVGFSHKSNRPFDIGWTKASCNSANNDTGGRTITASAAGKISHMPNTLAGGDFMCLSLTGGGSIVLGHVKPDPAVKLGSVVAAGQKLATVRTSTDPAGQNAGIAHLHYEAWSGSSCYTGSPQAFTGAWRMQCTPDLPYVATPSFYNGTAITACAPDAGAEDAGSDARHDATADAESDATTEAGDEPSGPGATPAETSEPAPAEPAPSEDAADEGCAVVERRHGAREGAAPLSAAIALVLAALARARAARRAARFS